MALGFGPYFDQPFYVGFNVGGYELGLDPNGGEEGSCAAVTYWGVDDIVETARMLADRGVRPKSDILDVGDGIRVASFFDAAGNAFGIIENPHFKA